MLCRTWKEPALVQAFAGRVVMIFRVAILALVAGATTCLGYASSVELMPSRERCVTSGCHLFIAGK